MQQAFPVRAVVLALALGGCLVPPLPLPNAPADPEIWYGEAVRADGTQVRVGGYLAADGLHPLLTWKRPGDERWSRRAFLPLGTARHGAFVSAFEQPGGLALIAASDGATSLAFVALDDAGAATSAVELELGAVHGTAVRVATTTGGPVVGSTARSGGARVVWLDPTGQPLRATTLTGLLEVTSLVAHPDGALNVLGPSARVAGASGVALVTAAGAAAWERHLRFKGGGPVALGDGAVVAAPGGGVLVSGHHRRPERSSMDLELARFDAAGTLLWQKAIPRPFPSVPLDWTIGPISQRAGFAEDGGLYVAATAPLTQQGSSHLVLLELDASGEVRRQAAVTNAPWQLTEVLVAGSAVRVRGSAFFECTFERAALDGCEAPRPFPPFVAQSVQLDVESPATPDTAPLRVDATPFRLEPWTPPD